MDYTAIRQLQIRFSAQTEYGRYTDALYYPEGNVPDEKALAAEVQKRVDAWVATVSAPPEPIEEPEPEWVVTCEDGEIVEA
jgi:hypothetical protein